jgi:hypothetical protein
MLKEQIEIVQGGGEPMALVREPERNRLIEIPEWISEAHDEALTEVSGTKPTYTSMDSVFDARQEVFEVPFGRARPQPSPAGRR